MTTKKINEMRILSKYSCWFYRAILIVIVLSSLVFAGRYSNRVQDKPNAANLWNNFLNLPERGPQDSDLDIAKDENNQVLDETLQKIFPEGTEKLTDEEKAIELTRFVPNYFYNEAVQGINVSKLIIGRKALCQGMATVFTVLARKLNIPARTVSTYYIAVNGSHVMGEVYYNGGWHLFEPTYGLIPYSRPNYDKEGYILSFRQLQLGNEYYLQQLTDKPWTGQYSADSRNFGVQPIKNDYNVEVLKDTEANNFDEFWRNEFKRSFPVAYGNNSWVSMPIDINLENTNYQILGELDDTSSDLAIYNKKYTGASYLGIANGIPGAYNTWRVNISSPPQSVRIKYHGRFTQKENIEIIPLISTVVEEKKISDKGIELKLKIFDNQGILLVIPSNTFFTIDAIEIFKE